MRCRIRRLLPFLITIAAVTLVTIIKLVIREQTNLDSPVLLFYSAVLACAWYGGMLQGFFAIVLSLLASSYFFMPPYGSWVTLDTKISSRLILFTLDSVVVVLLASTLGRLKFKAQSALDKALAAKKASTESERRFRSLFEANMIGLIFARPDGTIIDANDYFLDIVGYSRDELAVGRLNWRDMTPPDQLPLCERAAQELIEKGSVKPFEKDYFDRQGNRVRVLAGIAQLQRETFAIFILDIRERKKNEIELENRVAARTSELRESTERLQQSERFLESVIENLPNMLFVKDARDLRFVRFNRAGEELLGYSRETLLGRNDYDFFPKEQADHFTAKDREVLQGRHVIDIPDEPLSTKNGMRTLHTKKIPILDNEGNPLYLLGISEDVTEKNATEQQRRARAEAENTANQLRFLSEASRALSESLDLHQTLRALARLLVVEFADWCELEVLRQDERGFEDTIIAHRDPADAALAEEVRLSQQPDHLQTEAAIRVLATGRPVFYQNLTEATVDQDVSHPGRREVIKKIKPHSVIHAPIQAYGKVLGVLTVARSKSPQPYTELEVELTQELGKRAAFAIENARLFRKAQEANRAKSAFLANMSHEVRTPLGAMLGFADLLAEESLEPEQMNYVNTVIKNGRQLLRIVDEILDLSKVESDRVAIEHIEFSLKNLIAEIMSLLEMQAAEKALGFRVLMPKHLPDRVISDPTRLRQILTNVIGNAIKFTAKGFVEIRVDSIERLEQPNSPLIEFRITDSGIGIQKEQAEKLFQPFVQADNSMTRRFGGTGLGLFVSRRLARLLGGDVILGESGLSMGSQFIITVGVDLAATLAPQPALPLSQLSKSKSARGRILVVDDSPDNRTLIHHYLSREGFDSDGASTGVEAIDKALHFDYDLILMDLQMPEMDGLEAVRRLRAKKYAKPIVALTAHAMKGDREHCLNGGFDDYLGKPIDRERLRQAIDRFTQNQ